MRVLPKATYLCRPVHESIMPRKHVYYIVYSGLAVITVVDFLAVPSV